jgi:hypothetical protein
MLYQRTQDKVLKYQEQAGVSSCATDPNWTQQKYIKCASMFPSRTGIPWIFDVLNASI